MKPPKFLISLLVSLTGFLLLAHHVVYQPMLSQGDHGRDLYAFAKTLDGHVPYRDYWWVYGPLMPYYYGLFFKIFGIGIKSALLGKTVLTVFSGVFIFNALSLFIPPLFAFLAAMWFWMFNPEFFFTYNHAGGITVLTAITSCLFLYIRTPRAQYLYEALFGVLILALIKVNFGLAALFVTIVFFRVYDKINRVPSSRSREIFAITAAAVAPLCIFLIYYGLLSRLPVYYIRQCLPYLSGDQPYHATLGETLKSLILAVVYNIKDGWPNRIFALVMIGAIVQSLRQILSRDAEKTYRQIIAAFLLLVFFYTANLHEYFMSGVIYRSYWAVPFSSMMIFLLLGFAVARVSPSIQRMLFGTLFILLFMRYTEEIDIIRAKRLPEQHLAVKRGDVITDNSYDWFTTVNATTEFLKTHLPKGETFFALPYDPLYYYLTDKTSPTRQLIFFEHINIPTEQEQTIIAELEAQNVNTILISSRAQSGEPGLGVLGATYCPLLGQYITDHFEPVIFFGDWKNPPGWAWNHGTQILKRKKSLSKTMQNNI